MNKMIWLARFGRHTLPGLMVVAAAMLPAWFLSSGALAQEPPPLLPSPPPSHNVIFQVEAASPAQYDEELSVVDFEAGAWTYQRKHDGLSFFSVADGTLTLRTDGKDVAYTKGQSFRQTAGAYYAVGNLGSGKARLIVTTLTSPGLVAATNHPQADRPAKLAVTAFTGKATLTTIPANFVLNQAIFEFRPGAGSGAHVHPSGQGLQIVMSGEQRHKVLGGEIVQKPGEVLHDLANRPISHENRGSEPMTDVVSYVFYGMPAAIPASLPGVQPLPSAPSAAAPAITPPRTGDAGLQ
jgi:quercetin dioxygenase-like cupin family protein